MTSFSLVYDSFFSKITDDMYMELTQLDTFRMLEQLLLAAIEKFEFPRVDLTDYTLYDITNVRTYNGAQSGFKDTELYVYSDGAFNHTLSHQEINILSVYMVVEWLGQQLASIQNTRMKYSGSDYKFSSQASHMQRILQIKKDYERQGFHLQRLYKRRAKDENGIMRSTFGLLREPPARSVTDLQGYGGKPKNAADQSKGSSDQNKRSHHRRPHRGGYYVTKA